MKEDIVFFLNLYKLAKREGKTSEQIVKLLQLADEYGTPGLSFL